MNRKLESLKQYFYFLPKHSETVCGVKVFKVTRHRPTIVLLLIYCSVDNRLFEVSSLLRCVKSLLLLWQPRSWF